MFVFLPEEEVVLMSNCLTLKSFLRLFSLLNLRNKRRNKETEPFILFVIILEEGAEESLMLLLLLLLDGK